MLGRLVQNSIAWVMLAPLSLATACGDDDDCSDEIAAARDFLRANRACQTDADCVSVDTGCHTFANGICGQAPLNRGAAATTTWQRLSDDLAQCDRSCAMCLAALTPHCSEGLCGGEP